jgi:hypothetical protein
MICWPLYQVFSGNASTATQSGISQQGPPAASPPWACRWARRLTAIHLDFGALQGDKSGQMRACCPLTEQE